MRYTVAVPYYDEVDFSKLCNHVHPDLPQKSCVIAIDRFIGGQPVCSADKLFALVKPGSRNDLHPRHMQPLHVWSEQMHLSGTMIS
jgi:hypothetical protein